MLLLKKENKNFLKKILIKICQKINIFQNLQKIIKVRIIYLAFISKKEKMILVNWKFKDLKI